uniref:CHK kinase-like domain-containing protein n=1 Tax=Cuerna arida TaxID=1464854 RepID=A0A1B6EWP8_9HEMI
MEGKIPSWLNEDFLAAALQGGIDQQPKVSIVSFKVAPSTCLEGYSSDIHRVKVNYKLQNSTQEHSKSLVIKVPDVSGLIYNVVGPIIIEKELLCYNVLLPKIMKKVNFRFAPIAYKSTIDKVIVMEDLRTDYCIANKDKQLDFEHCKLVVATMAKYHASTVALYCENTDLIEFVGREGFFPEGGPLRGWVELGTRTMGEVLKKMEGCERYADFFLSRVDTVWDELVDCLKPKAGRMNVLNHGDLWTNNLFFKYNEEGKVAEVKFIDYQVSRYCLSATDLVYFVYSSAQHEVREHRQKELYGHYLEVLNGTLEQLECPERLTPEQFKEDMKTVTPWFIGVTVFAISLIFAAGTQYEPNLVGYTAEDFVAGKPNPIILKVLHGDVFNSRILHMVRQYLAFIES